VTTLSLLPRSLRRLFSRIDAAGTTEPFLAQALDYWRTQRGARLLPQISEIDVKELGPLTSHLFILERKGKSEWRFRFIGGEAKALLGPSAPDATLSRLGNHSLAARLRLLVEWSAQTKEAVSATFVSHRESGEILMAPLGSDDQKVEAAFGGIASRHVQAAG
jgi:hypothetical protein